MTNLRHLNDFGTARFITFSCYRRLKFLSDSTSKELFIKHLDLVRKKYLFQLYGYVIMPKHVHLVLYPTVSLKMGLVIREIKSKMAREYFEINKENIPDGKHVFWQKRCYDYNCRIPDSVIEKINYCHNNPVKRGLVKSPGDWRWSSYNFYQGDENIPIILDRFEYW